MSLLDFIHSRNVHVEIHEQVFYQGKHQAGLARQRNTSPPGKCLVTSSTGKLQAKVALGHLFSSAKVN